MPCVHLLSGHKIQFQDWLALDTALVRHCVNMEPGLYVLGVQMNRTQEPVPVYVGVSDRLRDRLLYYCALAQQLLPSSEQRPIVQVMRRVPAKMWHFSCFPCENPHDFEAELIIGAELYWPHALLVNVQGNALASGHGSPYLVERLIDRVQESVGNLPKATPAAPSKARPWESSGMSRAAWYRRRKARILSKQGNSREQIAEAMNVHHTTVARWLTE